MKSSNLRILAKHCRDGNYLKPKHWEIAWKQVFDLDCNLREYTDQEHLVAAADWIACAQDATADGGVVGRYSLKAGWTSSYPETTGYLVPTLLQLARVLHQDDYFRRAQRAVDFLLGIQLPNGAFPGLEIAENLNNPSPFNTAQIMHGLQSWAEVTKDERCIQALRIAGTWLCEIQEPNGAWLKHFYLNLASTYSAHLTCWLAEAGQFLADDRMLSAASRHLSWVLQHYTPETGWFDLCGFTQEDHERRRAVTHTIAYTLWGVLRTAEVTSNPHGKLAAETAAYAAMRRLEVSKNLPGVLDHRWRPQSGFTCLTGNAQFALIWLHMYRHNGDPRLLNAAIKAIDKVKAAQVMTSDEPGIRGGIPGSHPIWGPYIPHAFPNWAAKYFVDALLAKREALEQPSPMFRTKPSSSLAPTRLPAVVGSRHKGKVRVAMLTNELSIKLTEFMESWSRWGFQPDLVLIERPTPPSVWRRLLCQLAEGRLLPQRFTKRPVSGGPASSSSEFSYPSVLDYCRKVGFTVEIVESLNGAASCTLIHQHQIDLLVHSGGGILRKELIKTAPMGVLNAHMGLLPSYRGMNVTEWSAWNEDPIGCTVHFIDAGIDTGDILLTRRVDASRATNVRELRTLVNREQIELLGEVLRYVMETGETPPRFRQTTAEGLQYFRMHPEILQILNERLNAEELHAR